MAERDHNLRGACWCDQKFYAICGDCDGVGLECWCLNGWRLVPCYGDADLVVHSTGDSIFHHAPLKPEGWNDETGEDVA